MAASLRLAEKSAEITATAPALIASRNEEERVQEQERLVQRLNELSAVTEGLKATGAAEARLANLIEIEGKIATELKALNGAVEQRLRLSAQGRPRSPILPSCTPSSKTLWSLWWTTPASTS